MINTTFGEPIIHTAEAPPKKDSLGRNNKSSEYKFLIPLWKVALLVQKKKKGKEQKQTERKAEIKAQFFPRKISPKSRPKSRLTLKPQQRVRANSHFLSNRINL